MKKYQSPTMAVIKLDPKEAFSAAYPGCALGEGWDLQAGTNCQTTYYTWEDATNHQCYATVKYMP